MRKARIVSQKGKDVFEQDMQFAQFDRTVAVHKRKLTPFTEEQRKLIHDNKKAIYWTLTTGIRLHNNRIRISFLGYDEILHYMTPAILYAIQRFDPDRSSLPNYLLMCCLSAHAAPRRASRFIHTPHDDGIEAFLIGHFNVELETNRETPEHLKEEICTAFQKLSEDYQNLLTQYFGLGLKPRKTLEKLAKRYKCSKANIGQHLDKALRQLANFAGLYKYYKRAHPNKHYPEDEIL